MTRRHLLAALALALVAAQLSCGAATVPTIEGPAPITHSMPAARQGLLPEYRIFYDALVDYGDWTLIEPYGYVFRPSVNFVAWRPYSQGFWVPSDEYGWVWVSAEPFGWVTFHYGSWLYDRYEGWVWVPGVSWAPAQVSWVDAGNYVGWAPLAPPGGGGSYSAIPGGPYIFAPISQIGSTDLPTRIVTSAQVGAALQHAHLIQNTVSRDGIVIERGPRFEQVERATGFRITPVKVDEQLIIREPGQGRGGAGKDRKATDPMEDARHAAEQAAKEARALLASHGALPSVVPVLHPVAKAKTGTRHAPPPPLPVSAARDSTP